MPPYGLGDFDLVLSYTGGDALRGLAREFHARNVQPLYGSADPSVHRPVRVSPDYASALSYLGTYAADRQEQLAELFLRPAHRFPELKFMLGGSLYPASFPWALNIFYRQHVPPHDHPAFYCSSRLTLNITRRAMADSGYCPSGRLFEAAACGTPIISDIWQGLDSFFEPGSEILTAGVCDDVAAVLQMSDSAFRRIAAAARERVLTDHTADIRALQMERALESAFRDEPAQPEI
jgi:spore maturation protein CgeB